MDTIIYIYLNKALQNPAKEVDIDFDPKPDLCTLQSQGMYSRKEFNMGAYKLVRIGMQEVFLRLCQGKSFAENTSRSRDSFLLGKSSSLTEKNFWQRVGQYAKAVMKAVGKIAASEHRCKEERVQKEEALRLQFLQEIIEDRDHSYVVCQEEIPFLSGLAFGEYLEEDWIMHMMGYARLPHYIILGKAYCLPRLLRLYAKEMKSLKWILPKRQYKEEYRELVEELYEEYGLTVDVRLLEEEADYRRCGLLSAIPAVVVDFCEEEKMPIAVVARGSIWIDMISSEEKWRRLEERDTGISYFSLKKEWKQPQKALNILDTTGKNGYNT